MEKIIINTNKKAEIYIYFGDEKMDEVFEIKTLADVVDLPDIIGLSDSERFGICIDDIADEDPKEFLLGVAKALKMGVEYNLNLYKKLILNPYELFKLDFDYLFELVVQICKVNKKTAEEDLGAVYLSDIVFKTLDFNEYDFNKISMSLVVASCISKELGLMSTEECFEIRDMCVLMNMGISQEDLTSEDMAKSLIDIVGDNDYYLNNKVAKRVSLKETETKFDFDIAKKAYDNICFTDEDMKE